MIGTILALYDFGSKQEYIYRTSKIKEISGASVLLAGMYRKFNSILQLQEPKIELKYTVDEPFELSAFVNGAGKPDGEVLYDGGGNLMVLWRNEDIYTEANRRISTYMLKYIPSLSLICSSIPFSGIFDDVVDAQGNIEKRGDRSRLFEQIALRKMQFPSYDLPSVMPFTQIDPMTFLPVTYKRKQNEKGSVYPAFACSLSSDRYAKASQYGAEDTLDQYESGLLAVIYIDGNAMGSKLIACRSQDYNEGVNKLRFFSKQVNRYYVEAPIEAIRKKAFPFRKVVGGGDEITLICRAEDAFEIMKLYFDELSKHRLYLSDKESFLCTSCACISVFHAKSPFNVAYEIAEATCEIAKMKSHIQDGNYFCFYYCHSGVTNSFEALHSREQQHASGKPYEISDLPRINAYAEKLRAVGRANVKVLGDAAQISKARYAYEVRRVNAYLKGCNGFDGSEEEMKLVYDMSEFYDLWFGKEVIDDEKNASN